MKAESILIVDDEQPTREIMRESLQKEGYHVLTVGSADEALRRAKKEDFDLVLADIVMPSKGGLELVEKLREVNPDTTPLLMRGYPDIETARAAMRMGVYDCIADPSERSELCAAIAKALRRRWLIKVTLRRRQLIEEGLRRRQLVERGSLLKRLVEFTGHKRAARTAASWRS